ncbi:MAG: tetratricopeptide repeat protein [Saprospiraceae bacterium]|nr:tetratricopeptide repeat protein [Pyrinomonadaceae bacterium]
MKRGKREFGLCSRPLFLLLCIAFASIPSMGQERKPTAKPKVRTIAVLTEANAAVWINGVKYGKTDENGKLTITSISPATQTIRVRADGFKDVSKPLLPTQMGDIEIPLTKTSDAAELAFQQAEVLSTSDREKAIEAYNKSVKLRPKYVDAYIGLARIYSETGNFEKAATAIRDARRASPGHAEASAIEGRSFVLSGDEAKAIAAFKRAITEGKGFQPEAYTGLGLLYKEKAEGFGLSGDYEQESANYIDAAKYFGVAVKQLSSSPDGAVVYQLLGLVYEQQKKYKEAIAVYEDFLQLFPDSPEAQAVQSFIVQLKKQMGEPK